MASLLAAQLPDDQAAGDYRALYVGDPRLLPVPGRTFQPGVAYAVTDDGALEFTDRFFVPSTRADEAVEDALALIAGGSTLRAGRLLAPLGIRYVVIPYTNGADSTSSEPIPVPDGLVAAFENQLDLGAIYGPPSLEIFVNQAFVPVGAQLTGESAEASRTAGEENLAQVDLDAQPSMIGVDAGPPTAANEVIPGVVHVGIPFDERIELTVDGTEVDGRPGFGVTTAFDVETPGTGRIAYDRDESRGWWTASQLALWFVVLVVAAGARAPFVRRRVAPAHDETLIDLDEQWDEHADTTADARATAGIAGEALDPTRAIVVTDLDGPIEEWFDERASDAGPDVADSDPEERT